MKELGRSTWNNTHKTRSLIRTPQVCPRHRLQTEEAFTVKEYKHTHTHTHRHMLNQIKYTTTSKNVLFKPLCKKNFANFKLRYREPHLWNKFIVPNNNLLESVTINISKIQLKKTNFVSTNKLKDF